MAGSQYNNKNKAGAHRPHSGKNRLRLIIVKEKKQKKRRM